LGFITSPSEFSDAERKACPLARLEAESSVDTETEYRPALQAPKDMPVTTDRIIENVVDAQLSENNFLADPIVLHTPRVKKLERIP
jgi:hypothetical protein